MLVSRPTTLLTGPREEVKETTEVPLVKLRTDLTGVGNASLEV